MNHFFTSYFLFTSHFLVAGFLLLVLFCIVIQCLFRFSKIKTPTLFFTAGITFSLLILIDIIDFMLFLPGSYYMSITPGMLIDIHPIPDMIMFGINWLIPLTFVALLVGIFAKGNRLRSKIGLVGLSLCIISFMVLIYLGIYLFSNYIDRPLKEVIWWF